jgi:hypothetical protein
MTGRVLRFVEADEKGKVDYAMTNSAHGPICERITVQWGYQVY